MKKIEKLFRPAISLMNRLNYPQKFTLISSVFVLPLSLVMYLLISEIQSRNDFAEKEKIGNIYLRPLRQLWADIPLAQIITNDSTKQNTDAVSYTHLTSAVIDQECPVSVANSSPVFTYHSLIVLSSLPVAKILASGLNATAVTAHV